MGNVEGRDIYEGHVRVVICDGFVGNVLLKAGEGAVEFLFSTLKEELARLMPDLPGDAGQKIAASLKRLKTRFEYEEFGGGPAPGHPRRLHHLPRRLRRRGRSRTPSASPAPWPKSGLQCPDRRAAGRKRRRRAIPATMPAGDGTAGLSE